MEFLISTPPSFCGRVFSRFVCADSAPPTPEKTLCRTLCVLILLLLWPCPAPRATAQEVIPENPVYFDDSPAARDVLIRLDELIAQGSRREAIRILQQVLDRDAERVLPSPSDADLHITVRRVFRQRLTADPRLLADYREVVEPEAARLLAAGRLEELVRTRALTPSGFEGILRLAQLQLESARFEAAWRTIAEADDHPDFSAHRDEVVRLARLIAGYLQHDGAAPLLQKWSAPAPEQHIDPPEGLTVPSVGPTSPGPETDLAGIVPQPLASVLLSPADMRTGEEQTLPVPRGYLNGDRVFSWSLPVATEEAIYTNDGDSIAAWDRFTLRQLWRIERREPTSDDLLQQVDLRRRQSRRIEDSSEVTVAGDRLIAVTGLAVSGTRQGDGRVHCIDRHTGQVLWSVDVAASDPQLADSSMRGPAEVIEGTVVIAARKSARERRIISVYLAGFDLRDGSLRWVRLIGSAGALPFQTAARFPERLASRRGVVYRCDEIGLVAAVRADNGEPLWVRRFPSFRLYDNEVRPAWMSAAPIVHGSALYALSPNREQIVCLDAESGAVRSQTPAGRLGTGSVNYLLATRQHLVAVTDEQIGWMRFDTFPQGPVHVSEPMRNPEIVGRAAVAGEMVVVPLDGAIATLDLRTGRQRDTAIDRSGNALALDGQLLVVDSLELHNYMVWETASGLLRQRMESDPQNPAPAATLAELAYRAGKFDRIIESVDLALQAIGRNPQAHEQVRASLFHAVLKMLDPESAPDQDAHRVTTRITRLATLQALSERLEALAELPEEIVAHRLVEAGLHEAAAHPDRAVESLQEILADPLLASTFWQGGLLTIRADLEATRRLRELLERRGWNAYTAFEREAYAQLDVIGNSAPPDAFEALAKRYPFSSLAPRFWLMAAERAAESAQLRLVDQGVRSLAAVHHVGGPIDPDLVSELYGRLIVGLIDAGRAADASLAAADLQTRFGDVRPTQGRRLLALDELLAGRSATASEPTRAHIGPIMPGQAEPRLVQGRMLLPTLETTVPLPADAVLLVAPSSQKLRLLALNDSGELVERWAIPAPFEPILLEHTRAGILIAWLDPAGVQFECLDPSDGRTIWKHRPFEAVGERDGVNRAALLSGFVTPLEGRVFTDQLMVAADEQLFAVAERSGRLLTIDKSSGAVLWSGQCTVERVFDIAIGSGMLVVAGSSPVGREQWRSAVVALNARTGEVFSRLDEPPGTVRWVRLSEQGLMIAGLDRGLVCVDLDRSELRWMLAEEPAIASLDAWVFGDRLYVLDQGRELWRIDIPSGRLLRPALETRSRLADRVDLRAVPIGSTVLFASASGLLIFDADGRLQGVDAFDLVGALISSEPGDGLIAMVDTAPFETPDRLSSYALHLLSTDSGRLVATEPVTMPATPESVMLLDGLVLISGGEATMVLQAPAKH